MAESTTLAKGAAIGPQRPNLARFSLADAVAMYPPSKDKFNDITTKQDKGEYAPGVVPMSAAE